MSIIFNLNQFKLNLWSKRETLRSRIAALNDNKTRIGAALLLHLREMESTITKVEILDDIIDALEESHL